MSRRDSTNKSRDSHCTDYSISNAKFGTLHVYGYDHSDDPKVNTISDNSPA